MEHAQNPRLLLVPSLLPDATPESLQDYWPETPRKGVFEMGRIFSPPFVLKGLFSRIIARAYQLGMQFQLSEKTFSRS